MERLTLDVVVTEIAAQLAERRGRRQAYVALARAILAEDSYEEDAELSESAA